MEDLHYPDRGVVFWEILLYEWISADKPAIALFLFSARGRDGILEWSCIHSNCKVKVKTNQPMKNIGSHREIHQLCWPTCTRDIFIFKRQHV